MAGPSILPTGVVYQAGPEWWMVRRQHSRDMKTRMCFYEVGDCQGFDGDESQKQEWVDEHDAVLLTEDEKLIVRLMGKDIEEYVR